MRFITSSQIFDGRKFLSEPAIVVLNQQGQIEDLVLHAEIDPLKVEHYEGIISPGFINTHCHLELSHMKGLIPEHTGFVGFARQIMGHRDATPKEVVQEAMQAADAAMKANGIVAVGDISNNAASFDVKANSSLYYHTFVELLGLNPSRANGAFDHGKQLCSTLWEMGLKGSLAPHAPYSVSEELLTLIALYNVQRGMPGTLHNQESAAEDLFFLEKKGDFMELYEWMNVSLDFFQASGKTSLRRTLPALGAEMKLLLVHNTFSSEADIVWANGYNPRLYWCFCPNANLYIENRLPDVYRSIRAGSAICMGTDSLASNHGLSILAELQTLQEHYPQLQTEQLLQWATLNGAYFLGIEERYGSLEKGRSPGLLLLSTENGRLQLHKRLDA